MIYQLIKFAFVGASGVIVDFLSTWIIREKIKLNSYIANSIGFCFAATSNYVLNRVWTFASDNPDVQGEYIKFMIISTLGLAINNSVIFASDYPFMHLLYSQLLVCQRVCLQNTVCLICK